MKILDGSEKRSGIIISLFLDSPLFIYREES